MLEDTLIKCINGNKFSKLCLLILTCSKKFMIKNMKCRIHKVKLGQLSFPIEQLMSRDVIKKVQSVTESTLVHRGVLEDGLL